MFVAMADGPSPSIEASIKRERPSRRVFSIQSHVVHGYAGNKAAVFPLQRLDSDQLGAIYEGLSLNGLTTYSHLLTGYCGNPGFLQRIGGIVKDLKEKNENLLYVCDPVLGDHGKYYTPRELLPIYKEVIVPLADVLTPNCFELGELSGRKIENEADCLSAVDAIHDLGVSRIVVTSGIPSKEEETQLIALTSTRNKDGTATRHRFVFPKRSGNFVGTGDLFASLLIVWLEECGGNLAEAVGRVIGALQDVIGVTIEVAKDYAPPPSCKLPELRFIEGRRYLLQPSHVVPKIWNHCRSDIEDEEIELLVRGNTHRQRDEHEENQSYEAYPSHAHDLKDQRSTVHFGL
ncbi:pdxk-1, partial [Pristionchus pacificus]